MKFKELMENEDLGIHIPRLVTKRELELVKTTQKLAKLVKSALGETHNYESLKNFYKNLNEFNEFKFLEPIISNIKSILDAHDKMINAKELRKQNLSKIKSDTLALKKAILSGDKISSKKYQSELTALIDVLDGHIDLSKMSHYEIKNYFTAESSIFGTMQLLSDLSETHYDQVIELNTSKPLYTLINFPFSKLEGKFDEIHYIMYFMLNLTESPEPRKFERDSDFRLFTKVSNADNESFKELKKLINSYLHDNDKKLIPRIMELLEKNPTIFDANERRKSKITKVYRGVGFTDGYTSESAVLKQDKTVKYVATSLNKHTAKNFALMKGHLSRERSSKYGYIITYEVTPDAVLLDTQVLDTVYGESEILIDASKSMAIEVEKV